MSKIDICQLIDTYAFSVIDSIRATPYRANQAKREAKNNQASYAYGRLSVTDADGEQASEDGRLIYEFAYVGKDDPVDHLR